MAATVDDLLKVLTSIDAGIKELVAMARANKAAREAKAPGGAAIASDKELDGQHGDPVISAKDPRDWSGPSMSGKRLSECPPEYLDLLAERYDYFNTTLDRSKPDDAKKMGYNARDAARCRGWATRKRAGWKPPTTTTNAQSGNPFESDFIEI